MNFVWHKFATKIFLTLSIFILFLFFVPSASAITNYVVITTSYTDSCGSNCFTVPSDWNNSSNSIEIIGAGGNGAAGTTTTSGGGGGGGGYAKATNQSYTPGSTVSFTLGTGGSGTTTWWSASGTLNAAAGGNASGVTAGSGGVGGGSIATTSYTGGNGGSGSSTAYTAGAGGGGAAGPNGNGGLGGNSSGNTTNNGGSGGGGNGGNTTTGGYAGAAATSATGGNGGNDFNNDSGSGGAGGNAANGSAGTTGGGGGGGGGINAIGTAYSGGAGSTGTEWSSAGAGTGGGGGGGGSNARTGGGTRTGGAGGSAATNTGAGGGGGGSAGGSGGAAGNGANGFIVVSYIPHVLDHYSISVPSSQNAGTCSTGTNTVTAEDGANQPVLTDTSTIDMTDSGDSVTFYTDSSCSTPTTQYTLSSGVTNIYYKTNVAQVFTITATKDGSTQTGTSGSITVNPGSMANLVITLPGQTFVPGHGNSGSATYQLVGQQFTIPSITATDSYFNIVSSYTGAKTLAYSGPSGTPSYTTSVSFTSGQSTTTLLTTLNFAQSTRITVTDSGLYGYASSTILVLTALNQVSIRDGAKITGGTQIGNPLICGPFSITNQAQLPNAVDYSYATQATINGNSYIYSVGGSNGATYYSTISKGTINSNGDVTSFSSSGQGTLGIALRGLCATTATDGTNYYLYSFGGCDSTSACHNYAYGGQINSTGDVTTISSQTNMINNQGFYLACTSMNINGTPYVYVLGGASYVNGVVLSSVSIDNVLSGGSLGTTWTTASNQLPVAISNGVALSAQINGNNYIYFLGGINGSGTILSTVYKATVNSSGDISTPFSTTNQGQLPVGLDYFTAQIVPVNGNYYIYVLGGNTTGGYSNANYMAPVFSNGDIGTFTTVNQSQLPVNINNNSSAWASTGGYSYIYLIGGQTSGGVQATVYKAQISGTMN